MLLFSHLILSLVALTELTGAAKILSRQQQAPGTPLFLDEPSCDSYQCAVTFKPGDNATAHWLNAPAGNVVLVMTSRTSNITDQNVATVPGTTTNCNTEGSGNTCGQFSWIVPSAWVGGNFTLQATSQNDPSIASYTDTILVVANPDNAADIPFRALDPTAGGSSSTASPTASSTTQAGAPSSIALTSSASTPTSSTASNTTSNGIDSSYHSMSTLFVAFAFSSALLAFCL